MMNLRNMLHLLVHGVRKNNNDDNARNLENIVLILHKAIIIIMWIRRKRFESE